VLLHVFGKSLVLVLRGGGLFIVITIRIIAPKRQILDEPPLHQRA
jgi:hypothetical protein